MDGQEYISSFRDDIPPLPDYSVMSNVNDLMQASHTLLAGKIALLYGAGDIALLGSEPVPEVIARTLLDDDSEVAIARITQAQQAQNMANTRHAGNLLVPKALYTDNVIAADNTGVMSPPELTAHIESNKGTFTAALASYSDMVLEAAVLKIHNLASRREITEKDASKLVKDIISNERGIFNRFIRGARGQLTEERDFTISQNGVSDVQVARRVLVNNGGQYIPEWLQGDPEWDDPLQLICSLYTEIESYIALQEWVIDRGLPFMPVIAPKAYEQGEFNRRPALNTHANILLCGLLPSRNEIIPVQVKITVRGADRDAYHPGVVLVGTRDLGMQKFEPCIVDDNGHKKTGHRGITTYGTILEHYLQVHGSKGLRRGSPPTKQQLHAYRALLQDHSFKFFDETILPKMQHRVAV